MAYEMAKTVSDFFEAQGVKHQVEGNNKEIILTGFAGRKNVGSIKFVVIFDNEGTVHFRTLDFVHVPDEGVDKMKGVCNDLNKEYRWAKFTVDEDGDISAEADSELDPNTGGETCLKVIAKLAKISDEAYPTLMRALYNDAGVESTMRYSETNLLLN